VDEKREKFVGFYIGKTKKINNTDKKDTKKSWPVISYEDIALMV